MKKAFFELIFVLCLFSFIFPQSVYAYLDPGSGSYLIQIIIASIAGLGYIAKLNWRKIKRFFSSKGKKEAKNEIKGKWS